MTKSDLNQQRQDLRNRNGCRRQAIAYVKGVEWLIERSSTWALIGYGGVNVTEDPGG